MKVTGTIQHPGLNSSAGSDGGGKVQEISLSLELKADRCHEMFGFSEKEVKGIIENERKGTGLGDASEFLKNTYNLVFQDKYKFNGQKFQSVILKNVKGIGAIVILRFNLKFDQLFWDNLPTLAHPAQIIIAIDNVQMTIDQTKKVKPSPEKKQG